jgi:hypothetical protein
MLAVASTHKVDRLPLKFHHGRRRERAPRRAALLLDSDKVTSGDPAIDLLLNLVDARLPERSLQGVTQNRPFFYDRFALQIAITRDVTACRATSAGSHSCST